MKAILVVDLLGDYNLDELKAYVEVSFKDNNQILCGLFNKELKPMPQINEKRVNYLRDCGWRLMELECYAVGHNDCLGEILGETE